MPANQEIIGIFFKGKVSIIFQFQEMKSEMIGAVRAVSGYFFDPMSYHPYASGLDGTRRKNATRETTAPLKSWLNEHRKNPYPTKAEKIMLALLTKMTLTQVTC